MAIVILATAGICTIFWYWEYRFTVIFVAVFVAFGAVTLPRVYVASSLIDNSFDAESVVIAYHVFSGIILYVLHLAGNDNELYLIIFPGLALVHWISKEKAIDDTTLRISTMKVFRIFFGNAIFWFGLLIAIEMRLDALYKCIFRRKYIAVRSKPLTLQKKGVTDEDVLLVKRLTKFYGDECVLKSVSFNVRRGECFGLFGSAGSGKTVALEMISGLHYPNYGRIQIAGKSAIGYCPRRENLPNRRTCFQILTFMAALNGYRHPKLKANEMLHWLNMKSQRNVPFGQCSNEQRRKIAVAVALLTRSQLLVLDEPTLGIDPKVRHDIFNLINEMLIREHSVLIASNSMEECEALCARVGLLDEGSLIAVDAIQALTHRYGTHYVLQLAWDTPRDKEKVDNEMKNIFNGAQLINEFSSTDHRVLRWKIPFSQNDSLSKLISKVEHMALLLCVKDFTLSQPSFSDIYLKLVEDYRMERMEN
ncbi:unnamed protein product [Nippostrongylus brasiliensis]|uniref:ABC transporter domain-containing protein n=1 Tax=Nippostrongylus brasiliensis TaxID=27835 RepID=A0A0N4YRK6_NIPBR|nr:unnamed protein product [Nippostrongylus brasiliensis]